jgi:NADH dehydrogenase
MSGMKTLFITGSNGFIGSNLIKRIDPKEYEKIYCLSRTGGRPGSCRSMPRNVRFIKGDILDPGSYEEFLSQSDIVIHMAAITGKSEPEEYFRVNCEGTKVLLEKCRKNKVRCFLFISSIAADFKNIEGYHYAQAKIEAERNVKNSGLPFTILRPTIVIGGGSPILDSLIKLAKAPIVPIFGSGSAKIQPVYIDDFIGCVLHIIGNGGYLNETVTIGGPEQTTVEDFIRTVCRLAYNKDPRVLHLPVRPLVKTLLYLEKYLLQYLPFTAGQLASFTNDGITDTNPCLESGGQQSKNIEEMLKLSLAQGKQYDEAQSDLKRECQIFTYYLINRGPDQYIHDKYIYGHSILGIEKEMDLFDTLVLKAAHRNSFLLKLADTFTGFVYKRAVLRKKLLLLLAIMECCPSTYIHIDTVSERSIVALYMKTGLKAIVFVMNLIISLIVFSPMKFYSDMKKAY